MESPIVWTEMIVKSVFFCKHYGADDVKAGGVFETCSTPGRDRKTTQNFSRNPPLQDDISVARFKQADKIILNVSEIYSVCFPALNSTASGQAQW
jgi:hypothetical protein